MKKLTLLLLWTFTVALLFTSCNKDEVPVFQENEIVVNPPIEMVTGSVFGQVVDESGSAIANAEIIINTVQYLSNDKGLFSAKNINLNSYGHLVSINKAGYFTGSKMIQVQEAQQANLNVTLITKTLKGSVMGSDGGLISLGDGNGVALAPDGIKDSNGDIYKGEVNVYAKWLDPTDLNTLKEMPGDLRAVNSNSEIMQLATYGMLAVELESPSGQSLNIAEGSSAELTFQVPAELEEGAPTTIPLWYFDESTGYWIEEGTATLVDGIYIGDVSHFSFWNCDDPFPVVNASGTIIDHNGSGMGNIIVEIQMANGSSSGFTYTDSRGYYSGLIPMNENLILNVYNYCNEIIFTSAIGPFSADVIIQPITIDPTENNVEFSGILLDCEGMIVSDGSVEIIFDGLSHFISVEADGTFSSSVNICNGAETITAIGYNFSSVELSLSQPYTITGLTEIDLGTITTCDELESYFYYIVDGELITMDFALAQISANPGDSQIVLSGNNSTFSGYTTFEIDTPGGPGTFNPNYVILYLDDSSVIFCTDPDTNCPNFTITFEQLGYNSGDPVKATFNGTLGATNSEAIFEVSGGFKSEMN